MKTITYPTAKATNAKSQNHSLGYFHLVTIVVALLFFSLHDMSAQTASRFNAVSVNVAPQAEVTALIDNNPITVNTFDVYSKYGQIVVSSAQVIASFTVSNMTGRVFYNSTVINTTEFKTPTLDVPHQVLAVTVTFANQSTATKKVQLN